MRIFKNRWFNRFARQSRISDDDLCDAIDRAERGLVDADLGGGVIKQRIARPNEGRSGGFRALVCFRIGERAFFVFGFAKNDQDNISADELKSLRDLAREYLDLTEAELEAAIEAEKFTEVICNEDEQDL